MVESEPWLRSRRIIEGRRLLEAHGASREHTALLRAQRAHLAKEERLGHREYDEADLAWIAFIERLKETGMPLAQIKRYADLRAKGDSTLEERMTMLVDHRESVIDAISKWQENLDHLDKKIEHYKNEIKGS